MPEFEEVMLKGETTATNVLLQVVDDEIKSNNGTTTEKEATETLEVPKANTLADRSTNNHV